LSRHALGGTNNDFITSDTTLVVSGTNGALAAGEKIQVAATAAPAGTMLPSSPRRPGATTTPPTRTRRNFTYTARIVDTAGNYRHHHQPGITIDIDIARLST